MPEWIGRIFSCALLIMVVLLLRNAFMMQNKGARIRGATPELDEQLQRIVNSARAPVVRPDPAKLRKHLEEKGGVDDISSTDNRGMTKFMAMLYTEKAPELARVYIEAGANVNARDNEDLTPLMYAQLEHIIYRLGSNEDVAELTKLLIAARADVNARSKPSNQFSLRYDERIDYPDMTVLMWAAEFGRAGAAGLLTKNGAKVGDVNSRGWTAYSIAAKHRDRETADRIFFRNSTFLISLTRLIVWCLGLAALYFLYWSVQWYQGHKNFQTYRMLSGTVLMSLGMLLFLWSGVNSLPTAQSFALLAVANALLTWNWLWLSRQTPHTDMGPESVQLIPPSLEMRRIFLTLSVCLLFTFYRIVDPYVREIPWLLKVFLTFMLSVMAAEPILNEENWISQGQYRLKE